MDSSTELSLHFGAATWSWQVPAPLDLAIFMMISLALLLAALAKST